jgi:hypothetical protein
MLGQRFYFTDDKVTLPGRLFANGTSRISWRPSVAGLAQGLYRRCAAVRPGRSGVRALRAGRSLPAGAGQGAQRELQFQQSSGDTQCRSSRSTFPASGRSAVAGRRSVATTTRSCRTSRSRSSAGSNTMPAAGPCGPWCHRLQTTGRCDDAVLRATSIERVWPALARTPESSQAPDSGIQGRIDADGPGPGPMVGSTMMFLLRCVLFAACLVGLATAQQRTPRPAGPRRPDRCRRQ